MFYSLKSLNRIYKNLDRYFFYSPLAGSVFIGISIYFKIHYSTDYVDIINLVLNIISLFLVAASYSLLIISHFRKEPGQIKKLKIPAYTIFSLVYYIYGIIGVLVTTYYNIMMILVLLIALMMFWLIPNGKSSLYITPGIMIYFIIVFGQEFGVIPLHPEQMSYNEKEYFLILVFSIKCVLLFYLNISKVINLKLLLIEKQYCPGKNGEEKGASSKRSDPVNLELLSEISNILTDREYEVTQLLLRGFTYKEIAFTLEISINTVQSHIKSIYVKYYINSRTDLFRLYKERIIPGALVENTADNRCRE